MTKVIALTLLVILVYASLFGLSVCCSVYGWGLEPRSWRWIISTWIGIAFVNILSTAITKAVTE